MEMGVEREAEIGAAIERAKGVQVGVVIGAQQARAQKHRNRSPENTGSSTPGGQRGRGIAVSLVPVTPQVAAL